MKIICCIAMLFCAQICAAQKLYLEDLQHTLNLNEKDCESFLFQKGYAFMRAGSGNQNGQLINGYTTRGNKLLNSPRTLRKITDPNPAQSHICYEIYDRYEFNELEKTVKEEENYTRSDTVGSDRSRQYHKEGYNISFEIKRADDRYVYLVTLYHGAVSKKKFTLPKLFKSKEDNSR